MPTINIVVTSSNITERLVSAVRALSAVEAPEPESFVRDSLSYSACAKVVTSLCGYLDDENLARRADLESSNDETERAEVMAAELDRRNGAS